MTPDVHQLLDDARDRLESLSPDWWGAIAAGAIAGATLVPGHRLAAGAVGGAIMMGIALWRAEPCKGCKGAAAADLGAVADDPPPPKQAETWEHDYGMGASEALLSPGRCQP